MVRTYIRKRNVSTNDEGQLLNAIEKIKSGEWSFKEISEITRIPKGTLSARISSGSSNILGSPTALTLDEEVYLVKLIETLQERGELCTMQDVMTYATEYNNLLGLQSRFQLNGPTKDWYYGFVKR